MFLRTSHATSLVTILSMTLLELELVDQQPISATLGATNTFSSKCALFNKITFSSKLSLMKYSEKLVLSNTKETLFAAGMCIW